MINYIIIGLISSYCIYVVYKSYKNKKKGTCGGSCASCSSTCNINYNKMFDEIRKNEKIGSQH